MYSNVSTTSCPTLRALNAPDGSNLISLTSPLSNFVILILAPDDKLTVSTFATSTPLICNTLNWSPSISASLLTKSNDTISSSSAVVLKSLEATGASLSGVISIATEAELKLSTSKLLVIVYMKLSFPLKLAFGV